MFIITILFQFLGQVITELLFPVHNITKCYIKNKSFFNKKTIMECRLQTGVGWFHVQLAIIIVNSFYINLFNKAAISWLNY